MAASINHFLEHSVWSDTHRARLIPLGESAKVTRHAAGDLLFIQFHPADRLSLLCSGSVGHETSNEARGGAWAMGRVSWPWGALGWSGFLPPHRNATTARADTDVELLSWRHEDLARFFYADPMLAVNFFRIVLDSVRRQLEWVRDERLAARSQAAMRDPWPVVGETPARHRFAPRLITVLRRSAFFSQFDDAALERLAMGAVLARCEANTELIHQDGNADGLWILAAGNAVTYFSADEGDAERVDRFRTVSESGGILAGIPTIDGGYVAETNVIATSPCWFYRVSAEAIEEIVTEDPEFGRSFMQRHLARLAHLISAARLPRPDAETEPEITAVKAILEQNQGRIPVTSELHKVPHLLNHRLTVANALACLNTVRETGRYQERAISRTCVDLLGGIRAELHFYRDVLAAYTRVADAPGDTDETLLRALCDEDLARAFGHLRTEIHGLDNLPRRPGNVVIVNHLSCPAYYELPNGYHFSFDTAFVSVLLSACYGASPVRVVRQSPGAEYGHDLFYGKLGHITVPTLDSGIEAQAPGELEKLRRESARLLLVRGRELLARGENVLICPEGRSQAAADSPARLHSGAFRLALAAKPEPWVVPIALAGFDGRYKDAKLVAIVQEPLRLSESMRRSGEELRAFLDRYREVFVLAVREAQRMSRMPPAQGPALAHAAALFGAPASRPARL
jgi:CRP-like cAMP-binding protein